VASHRKISADFIISIDGTYNLQSTSSALAFDFRFPRSMLLTVGLLRVEVMSHLVLAEWP